MRMIFAVFSATSVVKRKALKNSGLNADSNPELFDAGALVHQLSCQVSRELVVAWVDDKSVDDGYMVLLHEIHVFEL